MSGGPVLVPRLHRMVRHGWRPWLGYDVASGLDGVIELRTRGNVATLQADGTLVLDRPVMGRTTVPAGDHAGFDALFPPNTPNRRNLVRRLYEIGVGA